MTTDISLDVGGLRDRVTALMPRARADLAELVAFRSVADPKQYPPEECERAAQYLIDAFGEAGLRDLVAYPTPDGSKAVFGQAPGPPGAPTVLLYCHYDVQPPLDEGAWLTPVFELTEKDGRWYGRGAADCKGNIAAHLTALRALGGNLPVTVKLIAEGSEEQGTGGLEEFVPANADLLRADAILVCDAGNFAVGVPTLTTTLRGLANVVVTVRTLNSAVHSGQFGGAAPDALLALIQMLATLHDADGNTTVRGLPRDQTWPGVDYPADQFRVDANVRPGVGLIGSGSPADLLWARPALTVLGIDCPPVVGSSAAVQPEARARLSLRVPPGLDATAAQQALVAHLRAVAPWGVDLDVEPESFGQPFSGATEGPAYAALQDALEQSYGRPLTTQGQGGSIPLCNVFRETYPDAEIMILGVEEPRCLIHAPNESVDPAEIAAMALAEALFLLRFGAAG
ncbi:dipeptidase [Cryptosporangium aurantiacum]|uniref:Acetylornithine deacetylase/Succinyl-diaminopimelate desuccinylase n=1 Tax=Cryptosporangium aurantiacum TaxID=134849 RepID=A0A1M7RFT0_9ACTN|nr:dipeptidase [Cryptosporangium aurantiacum]SHN45090.1 Acetylornithine deacetylase/Succinyl-diaminopimelate desuccinylase [Cryptosporangium aurantiacum]